MHTYALHSEKKSKSALHYKYMYLISGAKDDVIETKFVMQTFYLHIDMEDVHTPSFSVPLQRSV